MIEIIKNCELEWDKSRGVLYVHNKDTGATILRICKLDRKGDLVDLSNGQIDITGPFKLISYPYNEGLSDIESEIK